MRCCPAFLRYIVFCVSLFCISGPVLAQDDFDYDSWDRYVQDGQEAMQAGRYSAAISAFEKAMAVDPPARQGLATLLLLGRSLSQDGRREDGVAAYLKILDIAAEDDFQDKAVARDLMNFLADLLAEDGDNQALLKISQKAKAKQLALDWEMDEGFGFHHKPSRAQIPLRVGALKRVNFSVLNEGKVDLIIRYVDESQDKLIFTFFVSHFPYQGIADHYGQAVQAMYQHYDDVAVLAESDADPLPHEEGVFGLSGKYELVYGERLLATQLKIYELDGWHFKMRATYSPGHAVSNEAKIERFLAEFPWPRPKAKVRKLPLECVGKVKICRDKSDDRFLKARPVQSQQLTILSSVGGLTYLKDPVRAADHKRKFCVKERLDVNGKILNVYAAKRREVGKLNISYLVEVDGGDEVFQVSAPEHLFSSIEKLSDGSVDGQLVQVSHQTSSAFSSLGFFDVEKKLPYHIFRRIFIDHIGSPKSLVHIAVEEKENPGGG